MEQTKDSFEVDWKFTAGDLIFGAETVVGKLPVKYVGEDQIYGDFVEIVEVNGEKINFKIDDDNSGDRLLAIIDLINKNLPDKNTRFELYETGGDSYGFKLILI